MSGERSGWDAVYEELMVDGRSGNSPYTKDTRSEVENVVNHAVAADANILSDLHRLTRLRALQSAIR